MPRAYLAMAAAVFLAVLFWFVPLVHIVPLDRSADAAATATFDAQEFAARLWRDALPSKLEGATDAAQAIRTLLDDPTAAREQFGRSQGVSRGYCLLLRGRGAVVAVDKQGILVALADAGDAKVLLKTGMVFGSAIRDATGILAPGDVATLQEYNEVSDQLNRRAESEVIAPLLQSAEPGKTVEFVACVPIKDPKRVALPIPAVPVSARIE